MTQMLASRLDVTELPSFTGTLGCVVGMLVWLIGVGTDFAVFAGGGMNAEPIELIQAFAGGSEPVRAITFSPDGQFLTWGSDDGLLRRERLCDESVDLTVCRRLVSELDSESFPVRQRAHVALSNYGAEITGLLERCVEESRSREARFRAGVLLDSIKLPFGFGHQREIRALAAGGGERQLLASAARDGDVLLWRPHLSLPTRQFKAHEDGAWAVAFSPDGDGLATGGGDHKIHFWNLTTGVNRLSLIGHADTIQDLDYSPDGKWLASVGGFDKTTRIWDLSSGDSITTLKVDDQPKMRVSFHPNGRSLASAGYGPNVTIWRTSNWSVQQTLSTNLEMVRSMRYSPDGAWMAIGGNDEAMLLFAVESAKVSFEAGGHQCAVLSIAFSTDKKLLATGDEAGTVRLWKMPLAARHVSQHLGTETN